MMSSNQKLQSRSANSTPRRDALVKTKRRTVYRPVLDNSYTRIIWPTVNPEDGTVILDLLCDVLQPIKVFTSECAKKNLQTNESALVRPPTLSYVTLGLNATTRALESQTRTTLSKRRKSSLPSRRLVAVFVARTDILPAILYSHFPILCQQSNTPVKLVQLPKHSMDRISDAVGISDVGIVGIREEFFNALTLLDVVNGKVGDITLPWEKLDDCSLNVKQIITTAPLVEKKKPIGQGEYKKMIKNLNLV
ncbi:RNase P subunit Pop3-domain-containing protein [Lipomyces japonicus]|uniref:RNase P subunit Pop3-domain-containing protein n=1 Tax=Lipomyces japonicus TaxID=56871 RepID=UPI0034CF680A